MTVAETRSLGSVAGGEFRDQTKRDYRQN